MFCPWLQVFFSSHEMKLGNLKFRRIGEFVKLGKMRGAIILSQFAIRPTLPIFFSESDDERAQRQPAQPRGSGPGREPSVRAKGRPDLRSGVRVRRKPRAGEEGVRGHRPRGREHQDLGRLRKRS